MYDTAYPSHHWWTTALSLRPACDLSTFTLLCTCPSAHPTLNDSFPLASLHERACAAGYGPSCNRLFSIVAPVETSHSLPHHSPSLAYAAALGYLIFTHQITEPPNLNVPSHCVRHVWKSHRRLHSFLQLRQLCDSDRFAR